RCDPWTPSTSPRRSHWETTSRNSLHTTGACWKPPVSGGWSLCRPPEGSLISRIAITDAARVRACSAPDAVPFRTPPHHVLAVLVRAADVELDVRAVAPILDDGRGADALHAIAGEDGPVEPEGHLLGQVVEVPSKLGRNGRRQEAMDDQPTVWIDLDVVDPTIVGDAREGAHVVDGESPSIGASLALPRDVTSGVTVQWRRHSADE